MASTSPQITPLLDFVQQEEEREPFLIEPFFPAGGICYLHGKGGSGKSFIANTFMRAIADGVPFLGKYSAQQGKVIYIQADMTAMTNRDRMKKVIAVLKHPENVAVLQWPSAFDVVREVASDAPWIEQLRAAGAALVIVDTVRKSHRLDENSNEVPSAYYDLWKQIVGDAALIFIAHDNKEQSQDGRADDDRARGAHAWIDDADVGIRLVKRKGKLTLRWSKLRTVEEDAMPSIPLVIDDDTQMVVEDAEDAVIQQAVTMYPGASNGELAKMLKSTTGLGHSTLMRKLSKLRPKGVSQGVSQIGGVSVPARHLKPL